MSFLSRLTGIPDASAAQSDAAAGRVRAEFNLGSLPAPDARVRGEIQRRQMIAAIKAYREQSGVGIPEAKEVVDAVVRGDRLVNGDGQPVALQDAQTRARVDQLVIDGQLIAAIQAYRQAYGAGLKEAKEAIELKRDQLMRD